jgi:hypothetical protein
MGVRGIGSRRKTDSVFLTRRGRIDMEYRVAFFHDTRSGPRTKADLQLQVALIHTAGFYISGSSERILDTNFSTTTN